MARLPLAAVLGLALAACAASQQPTPTVAPTRALPPPAASSEVDGAFDFALRFVSQAAYGAPGARSHLAPQYREQVGDLRQALGIRRVPDSYGAGRVIDLGRPPVPTDLSVPVDRRAFVEIRLLYGGESRTVGLTLERRGARWEVVAIEPAH